MSSVDEAIRIDDTEVPRNGVAGSENAGLFVCCRLYGSYPKTAFEEVIKSNRRGTRTIDALTGDADFKLPVTRLPSGLLLTAWSVDNFRFGDKSPGTVRMLFWGRALTVLEIGALSDLDDVTVRIADVAANLAVLGNRFR
jgi:hypothetical protein